MESVLGTVVVLAVLTAIVALIILSVVKDRRSGKSSCGCNCSHCAMHGQCHQRR